MSGFNGLQAEIIKMVDTAIKKVVAQQETWVTAQELSERIPIFTANFLKRHGECLPREKMEYMEDGKICESRYMYPLLAIESMVKRGTFRTADGTMHAFEAYKKIK